MTVTARAWQGDEDLVAMQALLSRSWHAARPLVAGTPGDLEWWIAQDPEFDGGRLVRLWLDGDELIGWAFLQGAEVEWHLAPGYAGGPVHEAIVDWLEASATEAAAAGRPAAHTTIWAMDTEAAAIAMLERRGYHATDHVLSHWIRPSDQAIPEVRLPPGYRIRTVRWPGDLEARVEVHRAAFAPSRMVLERYRRLEQQPHYAPEGDFVVEAPDGSFAAFAISWFDPLGRVGELEPVGTHPDHRRLGLGRAVCLAAIGRLVDLGAEEVLIFSDASNAASEALYASLGATAVTRSIQYARPVADAAAPTIAP
jgi:mycothiol synthase